MATRIKQIINIVDECPEGNEWKFESKVKKLKPKESSKSVWLGLVYQPMFYNLSNYPNCQNIKKEEIKKLERFFWFSFYNFKFVVYIKNNKTYYCNRKIPRRTPSFVISEKNSFRKTHLPTHLSL